jgi:hypothetical protein
MKKRASPAMRFICSGLTATWRLPMALAQPALSTVILRITVFG